MNIRLVPALALAALAGACSTSSAYEPALSYGGRTKVAWEQCDVSCRHVALREMCPGAPEPRNMDERLKLEAGLMKYDSRSTLELHMQRRPECSSRRVAERPVRLAQNYGSAGVEVEMDTPAPPHTMRRPGHGPRRYSADLVLDSLGPNGRVMTHRRAPPGAIPCVVRGKYGKCVPREF